MAPPSPSPPLHTAPPPWTCKCTAYLLPFYASPSHGLPVHIAYPPLEAAHQPFSSPTHAGAYNGGLAFAQIIRYTDTPVGPYDELALIPGTFGAPASGLKTQDGGKRQRKGLGKDMRITGIWVSSEASLVNGRRNWNIPKHMARFAFTPVPGGGKGVTKVEVFAAEVGGKKKGEVVEPFFTAVIHSIAYAPSVPFDTQWMGYLGFSTHLLQPPLPEGDDAGVEVGTGDWKRSAPRMWCKKARFVWLDMRQSGRRGGDGMGGIGSGGDDAEGGGEVQGEGGGVISREHREEEGWENWWPKMGRWHLGLECRDTTLTLGEPEILTS